MKTRAILFVVLCSAASQLAAEELIVEGLDQPVEILTDRWGVAHIYASTEHDLFFAQGYNAVKDRLFQFEMWRRRATGTVSEILGRRELKRDIGARLHMFRKDMKQELAHYHPRGELIVGAFVDGINAYIERTRHDPSLLPIEFELLGIEPGTWTPAVVISRHQGLLENAEEELEYGMAVAAIGAEALREIEWFRPGEPKLELDPAIDGSLLKPEILELYRAFTRRIAFQPSDVVAEHRSKAASLEAPLVSFEPPESIGSNNWVVSGRFTQAGYPYVVNDPHRVILSPSLRYFVHLSGPGWNVVGGGEPVLPGISIGHNDHGGWGLTVFGQDNEDLYVYDTNPDNPNQYRYLDGWEDMRVIRESIPIEGESPETVELKYTRHGPVLYEDRDHQKAYALRAAWMEIGNAPYLASLRMNQATSWDEFRDACSYSRIPAENMIWGDVNKNIGYQAVGISPVRPNWSGLVPVPGDGRYEWDGYLPIEALPHVVNPEKGYWATANNFMVPDDYPYVEALNWTWGDEMRGLRVDELMSSGRRFTIVDMMRFQHDELSIPARNIVPLLEPLDFEGRERDWVERLLDWDFVLGRNSVEAAVYVSFERRMNDAVRDLMVPESVREYLGRPNMKRVIDWLVAPDGRFGDDPIAARNALLKRSFSEGLADLVERLGPDESRWQYGQERFKHVLVRHPLSSAVSDELRSRLDVGPAPQGGYDATLNSTDNSDNQTSGASFRVVIDTANWDNSVATNSPGQSGDPESPHYRDLFELWATRQYFPMFYTREKVESVTENRDVLRPAVPEAR